ncbi:MAG: 6-hydroxymethylpterin diphosphokinase MptE-like protein [Candidatus Methanomethylophilaceae archaeon]
MEYAEWEPVYLEIARDLGLDIGEDENSVRVLKALTMNSDLVTDDMLAEIMGPEVTVFGDAGSLERDIGKAEPRGTLISAGSATGRVVEAGIGPDIVVTDLDGDVDCQIEASGSGAVTLILAHGDNYDAIVRYAREFKGPLVLTTQSRPFGTVANYGGFTDGDRAVCTARHFGAARIFLQGFDFDRPRLRAGDDPDRSRRKLEWARRIIYDMNPPGVEIIMP